MDIIPMRRYGRSMASSTRPKFWLKNRIRRALPGGLGDLIDRQLFLMRRFRIRAVQKTFGLFGYNVAHLDDYASPLPVQSDLERNVGRWFKPSAMAGLRYDVDTMKELFLTLHRNWGADYTETTGDFAQNTLRGFGPGYPRFDARTLYYILREYKPRRYLEIGSGLSTYYCTLAAKRNAQDGKPIEITCIEPFPSEHLRQMSEIRLIVDLAQNVPAETFVVLEAGDILFIDSSHVLKIDGEVAYLFLEILPQVKPGVMIHIHDIPFPYNIPYPPSTWILGERWPAYWNEAMLVQAFLAFNDSFEIVLSTPLIAHQDEAFFTSTIPDYLPRSQDPLPYASLWIRRKL
jgi:hypothetical protein